MTGTYLQTLQILNRDVRLYLAATATYGFAQEGIRGVLLNLYLLRLGYGPRFIGLVSAVALLAAVVGRRRPFGETAEEVIHRTYEL